MKLPLKISKFSTTVITLIEDADGNLMFQSVGARRFEEAQEIIGIINRFEIIRTKVPVSEADKGCDDIQEFWANAKMESPVKKEQRVLHCDNPQCQPFKTVCSNCVKG
jgi:hypothetical protein